MVLKVGTRIHEKRRYFQFLDSPACWTITATGYDSRASSRSVNDGVRCNVVAKVTLFSRTTCIGSRGSCVSLGEAQ